MTKSEAPFAAAAANTLSGRNMSRETSTVHLVRKNLLALSVNIYFRRWSFPTELSLSTYFFLQANKVL
jgi:hypothetical protein